MASVGVRHASIRFFSPLILAAGLLTGCTESPAPLPDPIPSATPTSTSPTCPESGVVISSGPVEAAMGLRVTRVEMVNCGTGPYRVNGYPALRVLDGERKPMAIDVLDGFSAITSSITGFDGAPKPVELSPGQAAAAVVVWRNTVTDAAATSANATYLEIAPADGQSPQVVAVDGGLDLGTTGRLGVSPWTLPEQTPSPS
ncbi:DUF4232 domain-containing protein [Micromonospora sp. NPDC003197]